MATAAVIGETKAIARGIYTVAWSFATATGRSNPISLVNFPDKTVQVWFPTGAGFTSNVKIEGSNATVAMGPAEIGTATDWFGLTNPTGGLLGATVGFATQSGQIHVIRENPRWISARASTATGAITVIIVAR